MKKIVVFLLSVGLFMTSCEQSADTKITYVATDAISAYNLQFMTDQGGLQSETINPESAQDQWKYEYLAEEGDIVYVSGNYNDLQSALKIMILINGKVYKQASNEGDTLKYLTVSGTVPYQE